MCIGQNVIFEPMAAAHGSEIMDIFNYYIENSFAAFPGTKLPCGFFQRLLEMVKDYPALTIICDKKVIGFCFLKAYSPLPVFRETGEFTCFIHKDYTGRGIGKKALKLIEAEAEKSGIRHILAAISSPNTNSIEFHKKSGFNECGRFKNIGTKMNQSFDVVWMEKEIA